MAQTFKYVGEQESVDVPALGLTEVTRGTHVVVEDPAMSESMHGSDAWQHIPAKKRAARKSPAKKAAAKKVAIPESESHPVTPTARTDSEE